MYKSLGGHFSWPRWLPTFIWVIRTALKRPLDAGSDGAEGPQRTPRVLHHTAYGGARA